MSTPQNYDDPHRYRTDVHYRLYQSRSGPVVICVQDFDYLDYDGTKFLGSEAWEDEVDAQDALAKLLGRRTGILAVATDTIQVGQLTEVLIDPRSGVARVVLYDPERV